MGRPPLSCGRRAAHAGNTGGTGPPTDHMGDTMITSFLAKRWQRANRKWHPSGRSATGLLAAAIGGGVALALAAGPAGAQSVPAPPLPGATLGAALSPDLVLTDLFYTGTDRQLWSVDLSPMSEHMPSALGGQLTGGPAAAWVMAGSLSPTGGPAVFGRGIDNRLWWRHQTSSGWSRWASLGGEITSRPAAAYWIGPDSEILGVFARGADGAIWGRVEYHASGHLGWTSWSSYGGRLLASTGPAVAFTQGHIFLAAVGTDRAVWVRHNSPNGWTSWQSIGGRTTAVPGLATPAGGAVVAFARGTDNAAWYKEFFGRTAGVTAGWHPLGGTLTSGLTALPNQVESPAAATSVFALGADSRAWLDTGRWPALSGWQRVHVGP
jgi:hypothetical protein